MPATRIEDLDNYIKEEVTKNVSEQYLVNLRKITPVDTGRLRASWVISNIDIRNVSFSVSSNLPYAEVIDYRYNLLERATTA